MIISKREALKLLNSDGNLLHDDEAIKDMEKRVSEEVVEELVEDIVNPEKPILYTPKGTYRQIPPIYREMIALQANMVGNASGVARDYGISSSHATALKGGNVSHSNMLEKRGKTQSDIELSRALEDSLAKVRNKALDKIYASMDAIADDELPGEQPKTLALIAANLSRVVSSTLRNQKDGPVVNVQTVFYSPEKTKKEQYDVIDV